MVHSLYHHQLVFETTGKGRFLAEGAFMKKKIETQTDTVLKTGSAEPRRHMLNILSYCSFSPSLLHSAVQVSTGS